MFLHTFSRTRKYAKSPRGTFRRFPGPLPRPKGDSAQADSANKVFCLIPLVESPLHNYLPSSTLYFSCGDARLVGYIGEVALIAGAINSNLPVAVPGRNRACQSRLVSCRPLPLAQVAPSATGGAPIAPPYAAFFGYFLGGARKYRPRQGPEVGQADALGPSGMPVPTAAHSSSRRRPFGRSLAAPTSINVGGCL